MLRLRILIFVSLALAIVGCKKEEIKTGPALLLTPDNVIGKSGRSVEATLLITSPDGVKDIVMYKTINLQRDNSFGTNGILTATPVSTGPDTYEYQFSYQLQGEEVDKLVGINFLVTDNKGMASERDLTVNTTTSGQQIMYSRRWKLISRMWVSVSPAVEDIKECEKDNIFIWNEDSTYNISFGIMPCDFDGFNVYDKWMLSEDEKTLTQIYYSLFDPSNITTETYSVKSLTSTKMVLSQTLDLTDFGLSDNEVFESTYEPAP